MKIYLAGGMANLTFEESDAWRRAFKRKLLLVLRDTQYALKIYNPNDYYNFSERSHETEAEVRNFDLNLVRNADLIIVNFNDPQSIGTAQELAVANENRIPVLGLNESGAELHPWLAASCERIFGDMDALSAYTVHYYMR